MSGAIMSHSPYLYDSRDYQLLSLISRVAKRSRGRSVLPMPKLNPNGIITLAESMEERMAAAVLRLLDTLDKGASEERLDALRALRAEVHSMSHAQFRLNTGRALVQIMKDLVRASGGREDQLRLAHEFRMVATGRPSVMRHVLKRYYMLEMPEDWNQAVFDNHVHDANTKGRKNATHLIMDAWLKGIRTLTVIYYNYVLPAAAHELISAASIMGITVRIGLLFHAPHRGKLVDLIWIPRGFSSEEDFISFLSSTEMQSLMSNGRAATRWLEKRILHLLHCWNGEERRRMAEMLGAMPEKLDDQEFLSFVGGGQASMLHLVEFIYKKLLPMMQAKVSELKERQDDPSLSETERTDAHKELVRLDRLTTEKILSRLSDPDLFPDTQWIQDACSSSDCPPILNMAPFSLLRLLGERKSGCRVTLNLARLDAADVLELLWDCKGLITHLELFNLKDWQNGEMKPLAKINALQRAINSASIPRLKTLVLEMIAEDASAGAADGEGRNEDRRRKLNVVLQNLPVLCSYYQAGKLRATMGTDSTSRPGYHFGMGLAYPDTLPRRARTELASRRHGAHLLLPVRTELLEKITYFPNAEGDSPLAAWIRRLPWMRRFGEQKVTSWTAVSENSIVENNGRCTPISRKTRFLRGSVVTLGGSNNFSANGFLPPPPKKESFWKTLGCLKTWIANAVRLLLGFLTAALGFWFTQTGPLAVLGGILWFFISLVRSILQSVLGAGGIHRSSLLRWNNYVSWSDACITMMYSGPAAVLLEPILRIGVLEKAFGFSSVSHPVAVFSLLTAAYGLYKAFVHAVRGFPLKNVLIDLALTPLSIPVVLLFHAAAVLIFRGLDCSAIIPLCAALVTKIGCDTVISFGNGLADKESNLRHRMADYHKLFNEMLSIYSKITSMFPGSDIKKLIAAPDKLHCMLEERAPYLWDEIVVNALDMMYLWFYQPRANYAVKRSLRLFSREERLVFLNMQQTLTMEKLISQMFVDGLVGRNFAGSLSFYLGHNKEYLARMKTLCLLEAEGA